jgi:glucose dehydrogenase
VVRWVFNTIPQGPQDEGWDLAKDTWSTDKRYGGGIWLQPSVDPDLGMVYFNAANPSPNYDGSSRTGMNLFTNSMMAVDMNTGELEWYYQTLHHDIWDWDLASGPVLFDVERDGETVKGVASLGKTCYVYMLDRRTGEPINPIVETAVPTNTDVPGEKVWPTQPVPYTSAGVPQVPFCATYAIVSDPALASRVRQIFHPYQVNEFVITSPGNTGGANYGSPSFSPRTGLLYVTGKNDAWSIKVKPVGNTLEPGPGFVGHFGNIGENGETGVTATSTLAAYDPATGQRVWYAESPGTTNGGNLVTAGNVVFQGIGTGAFYGFDAQTGERLFTHTAERGIHASPLAYEVNGTQYVAIAATNEILVFALP